MSNNLPHSSVVFAWWDYGYWITVNTGLSTLSDNGTGNTTAIQDIATGFMLNETLAVQLMRQEKSPMLRSLLATTVGSAALMDRHSADTVMIANGTGWSE